MRFLDRARVDRDIVEVPELPVVIESLVRPGLYDDLDRLVKPRASLFHLDTEGLVLAGVVANANAELQAPA